jgi:hypothetical protein
MLEKVDHVAFNIFFPGPSLIHIFEQSLYFHMGTGQDLWLGRGGCGRTWSETFIEK